MIELRRVRPGDRELLWNIHQKYLYEMTQFYPELMDEKGNLSYGYFDAYFEDPERTALFICADGVLAGFALLNPYSYLGGRLDNVLAEFTVFPVFRRQHVASEAAMQLFRAFPGQWEIKFNEQNLPAKALWTGITAEFAPKRVKYSDNETVLVFTTGAAAENGLRIRRFENEDAQAVSDMIVHTLHTSNRNDYSPEYLDNVASHMGPEQLVKNAEERHFYVAEHGGRIIGCGAIGPYWGSATESCLFTVFVHPDYQGRGVGHRIMETLERDEYFLRARRVEVPASITGLPFYLKLGYRFKDGKQELDKEGLYRLEKFN